MSPETKINAEPRSSGLRRSSAGESLYQSLRRHAQSALPGELIASERDLAGSAGISRVTVRKVVARLVDEGLLERAHGKGTFVAGRARSGAGVRHVIFADDFPDQAHPYATSLLSGVLHQADAGIRVQAAHFRGHLLEAVNRPLFDEVCQLETDGLILPVLDAPLYGALKKANPGLRMVGTLLACAARDVACVSWDRFDCGLQTVHCLRERGARRLLFVHPPGGKSSIMDGVRYAVRAAGPAVRFDEISVDVSDEASAAAILTAAPEGLAFTDDFQARGILRHLLRLDPGYLRRTAVAVLTNAGFDILPREVIRLEVNGYEVGSMAMAALKTMLGGGALPGATVGIKVRLVAPTEGVAPGCMTGCHTIG